MRESKHTPGPWRKTANYINAMVMGRETAIASVDPTDIPDSQVDANARLIAAAPELLEACRESLRKLNFRLWQNGAEPTLAELTDWQKQLKDTIAKATGGTP